MKLEREVLVCYDVADNRRRARLRQALLDCGLQPVQESVFWGHLRLAEERSVMRHFRTILDPEHDRAFIAPVSLQGNRHVATYGHDEATFTPLPDSLAL